MKNKTQEIKKHCLDVCLKGGYGHPTSAFSCAEIVVSLYYDLMKLDGGEEKRDRFIMSKNHASPVLFPILNDLGFMTDEEYENIMQDGGRITNHTNVERYGEDFSGGALGIGLGFAAGLAHGAKMNNDRYLVFCLIGDAECYEGSVWEAIMYAGNYELNNLVVFLDRNGMGVTDFTENMLKMEPFTDKFKSFGWDVKRINGHDIHQILNAAEGIRERYSSRPLCIICDTVKGHGVDYMENAQMMHGVLPQGEQIDRAYDQLIKGFYERIKEHIG